MPGTFPQGAQASAENCSFGYELSPSKKGRCQGFVALFHLPTLGAVFSKASSPAGSYDPTRGRAGRDRAALQATWMALSRGAHWTWLGAFHPPAPPLPQLPPRPASAASLGSLAGGSIKPPQVVPVHSQV